MAIDIKNYIKEKIKTTNADIDTSPGSVFYDLLINPLSVVLEDYRTQHETILANESATSASDLSEDALDALGVNFLVERTAGTKATGYVTFYYSQPVTLDIPKGFIIQTEDGLEYEFPTATYVTKTQMEDNISSYPYYDSGLIPVISKLTGEDYNKPADTKFNVVSTGIKTPAKITNASPFTSGTDRETNTEYYTRLKSTVFNNSLASAEAIINKVSENFTSVVKTEVVGANNPLMVRDLTSLSETVANYQEEDFLHTYSGLHGGTYDSKHLALFGVFADTDETAEVSMPSITGWSKEFSDSMYEGVYLLNDMNYAETETDIIVREYFGDLYDDDVQVDLALILASGNWQVHDGINPSQSLFYVDEVRIDSDQLVLGKYLDPDDDKEQSISISLTTISGIMDLLSSDVLDSSTYAHQQLTDLIAPTNFNNTAPIFHKQIDQHLGVQIDCIMNTTDNTENGEMCYITLLRHSEVFLPHDGYGLAWRKQPEFLVRLNQGAGYYTDADVELFQEQYGVNPVTEGLVGSNYIKTHSEYWKYNVYLVDNDVLQEEVWVGHDQMWDQTSGTNQFLVAGKVWIEKEVDYGFRLKIYQTLGFEAWVFENDSPPADTYSSANRVLNRGATYPPYVPVSGDKVTRSNGVDVLETSQSHFGVAVAQTRNCEWRLDELSIRSFIENFPMHLFRFKLNALESDWDIANDALNIQYYGVGYDPVQYALAGDTGHSKVKAVVYNVTEDEWETIGTHEYTIDDSRALQLIEGEYETLSDYVDSDMYVNVAATAANSGPTFTDDTEHALVSYYCRIDNTIASGIHRGNATDIYVYDPDNIQVGTTVVAINGNSLVTNTTAFPGYIADFTEIREYVSKVPYDTDGYTITNNDDGLSFTDSANYSITFDADDLTGSLIELEYRYWTQGELVNDLFNSSASRYPASDIKVKVMPLTIIEIENLEYSGGLEEAEMKTKIKEYFNALTTGSFDKSDLVDVLYDNNADYVNLDITINITRYKPDFTKETITMDGQTYTIPSDSVSAFYTTDDKLSGVTKV